MASANAMARMDWTRIFVAAPGLRPTASEAFMPMNPTPSAAPSAAKPTWRFPLISANSGICVIYVAFLAYSTVPAIEHGRTAEILDSVMLGTRLSFLMLANQQGKHRREQHEHQG